MADQIPPQPPTASTPNTVAPPAPVSPASSVLPLDSQVPKVSSTTTTNPTSFPQPPVNPLTDDLSAQWRRTKCLNCGYLHEGSALMARCPRCGNADPDKFQEAD